MALLSVCVVTGCIAWITWPGSRSVCPLSSKLVPSCGALWGVATDPHTEQELLRVEREVSTHFEIVYRFHDLDDVVPTADERALVRDGRILHVDIHTRLAGTSRVVTWPEVTRGDFDASLARQARGIASLKSPVFVTFEHEPERPDRADRGTSADFVAAWRHVWSVFAENGADNAVWVWVVTGYPPYFDSAGRAWPGNNYVDWISWEAYNGSGCAQSKVTTAKYKSFADASLRFYRWVHTHGSEFGIDSRKPMMISEAGSVVYSDQPQLTADWYRAIPETLATHPQIRAVTLWDRPGNGICDYRFNQSSVISKAISQAGFLVQYHNSDLLGMPVSPAGDQR